MPYTYCTYCDQEIPDPEIEDIIKGYITCPDCHNPFHLEEEDKNEMIIQMYNDIEELKQILNAITHLLKETSLAMKNVEELIIDQKI